MVGVILAQRTNAIITQKLGGVEHAFEQAFHMVSSNKRQQATFTSVWMVQVRDQASEIRAIGQKPCQVIFESRQSIEYARLKRLYCTQRNKSNERAKLYW